MAFCGEIGVAPLDWFGEVHGGREFGYLLKKRDGEVKGKGGAGML
jgi:hypothetical protein